MCPSSHFPSRADLAECSLLLHALRTRHGLRAAVLAACLMLLQTLRRVRSELLVAVVATCSPLLQMRRRARPALLAASLQLLHAPAWAQTDLPCTSGPYTEVISREDVVRSGIARFNDLLLLADHWTASTVEGYDWDVSGGALTFPGGPGWTVFLDGIPVTVGLLGTSNLNLLPIHLADVECVEFVSGPDVRGPWLSHGGAIHIRTHRPDTGLTLDGRFAAGNEINDPGPFAYTPLASPNVDRIGPIGSAAVSLSADGRFARFSGKLDEFHATDERILTRNFHLYDADSKPRIHVRAGALTGGISSGTGQHNLLAGHTNTEDLLFFLPYGTEIPTTHRIDVAGAAGTFRAGPSEVHYHGSILRHELLLRPNAQDVEFDWGEQRLTLGLAQRVRLGLAAVRLGGTIESVEALTSQRLTDPRLLVTRLHAGAFLSLFDRWTQQLLGEWTQADLRGATSLFYASRFDVDDVHGITLAASYGRRLLETENSLWLWTRRGYVPPVNESGTFSRLHSDPSPRLFTSDLGWMVRPAAGISMTVRAYYRRTADALLPAYELAYEERSTGFRARTTPATNVSGSVVGAGFSLQVRIVPSLAQRFSYTTEFVAHGDSLYRDAWQRAPLHRLSLTTTYVPLDRFSLFARLSFRSAVAWPAFRNASLESDGLYAWQLPDMFVLDVAASKRFWRDHVTTTLALRNALNEPVRYHPAGAVLHMALHFAARVRFHFDSEGAP